MQEQMPPRQNRTEASPVTSTETKMIAPIQSPAAGTGVQK
jgi:hypothetical protein